jgi:hypothetical protein
MVTLATATATAVGIEVRVRRSELVMISGGLCEVRLPRLCVSYSIGWRLAMPQTRYRYNPK